MSLRGWRTSGLFAAWVVYWALLAVAFLGRPLLLVREIRSLPPGRANASLGFGDQGFQGHVVVDGVTRWSSHVSFGALMAWIVIPPLLLWIAWVVVRPRPEDVPRELTPGDPLRDVAQRTRVREER